MIQAIFILKLLCSRSTKDNLSLKTQYFQAFAGVCYNKDGVCYNKERRGRDKAHYKATFICSKACKIKDANLKNTCLRLRGGGINQSVDMLKHTFSRAST